MTRFSTRLLSKPDSTKDDKSGKAKNDSPTKTSIPPWKSLFSFTTRHDTPLLIGAAIFSVLASAANPAQAFITGKIFNGFVEYATGSIDVDGLVDQQNRWILYLVGIACASWAFHFLEFAAWMTFGEIQAKNARTRLFDGLCAAEIAWYDLCEDGIQVTLPRLQAQIKDLQLATSQPMGSLLAMICTSLIAIGQAFYNSWDLTLVTLAGAPAIAFIIVYFSIGMEKAIDKQQQSRELAQKCALETYSNVETVKCFNAEELHLDQYRTAIAAAARWYRRIVNRNAWQMALLAFLIQAMFVQSFYYGGILIRNGKKQPAQVITTFFSAIMAFQALQGLVPQLIVLEKGRLAGKAVQAAIPRYTQEPTDTKLKPLTCKGNIHLRGVSFKYPSRPDQKALSCVNLVISGGELTFLIGRSGSGKSTIGQLLVQFYDADSGTILLDGTELCEIDRGWLRNNITLVEQNSVLFGGTVADNIALGSDQSNAIEVKAAAEFALLQGIMFDTPDGLATIISSTGESVSGGQRQRIALARARLRDTPILILDESTSALDQINRELMMDAIRVWRQDKTTIIVTHDLSQILEDDYAVVMEHGKITQHGYRREMESRLDSPFCRLVKVGPSEDDTHKRASIIRQAVERPMSFLARAANALEWLPMTGLRASRTYPRRSETVYEEMQEDSRTLSKRLQDLLQDVGERAVATRTSLVARRRPQPDTVEEPIVRQDQAGLRPLLHRMWHDIPIRARLIMLLGCLGATIHGTCSPVFSYVLSKLLALYAQPGDTSQLSITYSLSILGIAAVDAFNIFLYRCSLETTSQLWVDTLRARASHKLVTQPQDFFEINTAERLTETLDRDAEEMRNLFGRFVIMMYIAAVILVVSFIWALTAQWKMTLLSMTAAPYIFVIAKLYTRVTEQWEVRSDKVLQEVNVIFSEAFTKVRTVRSLNLESHFRQRFLAAGSITFKIGVQRAFLSGFFYGLSTSAGSLATALVFYVGTKLVSQGASVNAIIQVFAILILTISNVSAILDYVPQMSSSKAMAWQMLRLAQLPGISHEQSGDTRIMSVGRIEFRDLDFSYPSRVVAKVLQGVNFVIEPGTTTAIVGGSGSGKSTIAKLLLKLYSASPRYLAAGFITVSGRDLTTIDTKAVRQMTAVVAQSARLFSMSIEENITYGLAKTSTHNSMDNVVMACQQAGIYEFVMSLPDAFKTMVGPGGIGLSGGQTQRLAIARALVRRPSLLILDEATSALDPESSILVKSTIRSLVAHRDKQMTILIITHNREMMDVADQILVLDHGCVVEKGGFNELLQRNGHLVNLLKGGIFE